MVRRWLRSAFAAAALLLAAADVYAMTAGTQTELIGPLRIRDMTPFNILRLEMLPALAISPERGDWAIEADVSYSNTFVMSDNVERHLEKRGAHRPLTQREIDDILDMREDAYYVDGEFGLLDLTFHYALSQQTSVYTTLPVYSFAGGFLDAPIEGFHRTFGLDNEPRELVARNRSQAILSIGGLQTSYLEPPIEAGVGDPVWGLRHYWPLDERWGVVLDGAVKVAWLGERPFLSTGTHDFGLQTSLQGQFERQGVYFSSSAVWTDGRVLGVRLGRRLVPTMTAAYEVRVTRHTNVIVQLYASESALQDSSIEQIRANKYEASLGFRSKRGPLVYGFALIENIANFENTPDFGVALTVGWFASQP